MRLTITANFAPMSQGQSKKKSLQDLSALADLHQAMGGEIADANPASAEQADAPETAKGTLYLSRDKKKRRGKMVTLVEGFETGAERADLKSLQKICGAGGAIEDGNVLIQGDHRDTVQTYFEAAGYRIKRKGG